MKARNFLFCVAMICACCAAGFAQEQRETAAEQRRKYEEALKPHLEEAKKTYPDAKKRFLAGLAPKERFLVTIELREENGRKQQAYIEVAEIKDGTIKGVIASNIRNLTKYRRGDKYSVPESEMIDWIIAKPDGTEEGNFVGKFLNEYHPGVRSY